MSKFKIKQMEGNQSQFGDNNRQTNKNTTINNNYGNSPAKPIEPGEILGVLFGVVFLISLAVWGFFKNIDTVYFYLELSSISSSVLGLISLISLSATNQVYREDIVNVSIGGFMAVLLFVLIYFAKGNVSPEIINLSNQGNVFTFFGKLSGYGQFLVGSNFFTALLTGLCALCLHFISIRQLSYSLANPNRRGMWYSIYRFFDLFEDIRARPYLAILIILIVMCIAVSAGHVSFLFN